MNVWMQRLPLSAFSWAGLLIALSSSVLGVLVLAKSRDRHLGRIWFIFMISVTIWGLGTLWIGTAQTPEEAFLAQRIAYAFGIIWIAPLFYHFVCIFLDIRRQTAIRIHYAIAVVSFVISPSVYFMTGVRWVFGSVYFPVPGPAFLAFCLWWNGLVFYGYYEMIRAYKKVSALKQNQIKYFFAAVCIGFSGGGMNFLVDYGIDIYPWGNFLACLHPFIMGYAILEYRLMEFNILFRKTLEYFLVTGILAAVYGTVIAGGSWLLGNLAHASQYSGAVGAVTLAFLIRPLHRKVQSWIDVKFFRQPFNNTDQLATLTSRLLRPEDTCGISQALLDTIESAIHPQWTRLYIRLQPQGDYLLHQSSGTTVLPERMPPENPWSNYFLNSGRGTGEGLAEMRERRVAVALPMRGVSGLVGFLLLGEKKSEAAYQPHETHFIRTAIEQAVLAYEQVLFFGKQTWTAEAPSALVQDIASGLVHEIKTPLAAINFPAQSVSLDLDALEKGERDLNALLPKLRSRMQLIMTQAIKAGDRIETIQHLASLESSRRERIDVKTMVESCLAALEPLRDQHKVVFHTSWDESLPAMLGHTGQLEIVFANLIKNAIEAAALRPDSQDRHVWITTRQGVPDGCQVDIEDSGPGVPAADRPRLFEKHFTTKGAAGTGVGLHLSHQLVQAMGGSLELLSAENHGAVFRVTFPSAPE